MDCIVRSYHPPAALPQNDTAQNSSQTPSTVGEIANPLAWLERLPSMAFLQRGAEISAANAMARDFVGSAASIKTNELFLGAFPAASASDASRQRFDCLLLCASGRRKMVSGAVQPFPAAGPDARLVLVLEPVQGPAGSLERDCEGRAQFFQDLFDSAPEPTIVMQGDLILQANREFIRLFGYSLDECIGADIHDLIIPDERRHEREMLLHTVASEGRASLETVRRTRSGEDLDVSVVVTQVVLGPDAMGTLVAYRDIRPQKRAEARLQHTALHDPLTGLANRALFLDRLTLTMARLERRPDRNFAVVFLDLDRFKQVNDTYGHAAGDVLLLTVTERLRACLRPQDTIARFGGDEFALLLDDVGSPGDIAGVLGRIQDAIQRPVDAGEAEILVSASMGIALSGDGFSGVDELMQRADQAMYAAKANGKARHEFFVAPGLAASPAESSPSKPVALAVA
jgi:diguanylate cyclase (GGDEF)-like protein/PAS domain S-box-containing protein